MSRRKASRPRQVRSKARYRPTIIIAFAVVLSLLAAWTMMAFSGGFNPISRQKGKKGGKVSTANFNSSSPSKEYIYAGGRLVATEEPTGGSGCTSPSAPGTPTATATPTSSTEVVVSWTPPSSGTVDHYQVERRNGAGQFALLATVPATAGTSLTDTNNVEDNTAYLYRIRAFSDASGTCPSPYSLIDLATTTRFDADPLVDVGQPIYAAHLLRLRTAVNAVRLTAGLSSFDWGDTSFPLIVTVAPATGGTILKDQVQKLRSRLDEARTQLQLPSQQYTNEPLTAGTKVFADHILQLRQGVR